MDAKTTRLTVLKRRTPCTTPSRHSISSMSSSLSSLSYPDIPSRHSSLSAEVEYDSSELATSTRTPSLSDSLYRIDVAKLRQDHATASRHIRKAGGFDANEDPFVDHTPRRCADRRALLMTQSGYQLAPQLLVRWSSGSYDSLDPCLSSSSTSSSGAMDPPTGSLSGSNPRINGARSLSNIMHEGSSRLLCPLDLPVTFVRMRSYAGRPCMGADSMSVWTSVNISADVEPISLPETSTLAPLDMVILFDSLQHSSVSDLTLMVLASSVLASNLVPTQDKIAIACVDGSARNGFELLLPLGFHSFEKSKIAMNTFSLRQLNKKMRKCTDIGSSIRHVSQLFHHSPRAAFCHLVFISAGLPESLVISGVDTAIGFHTISPQQLFPLVTENHPLGWHIFYDANADDPRSSEVHFMRKVSQVVRQIRTGLSPGALSGLNLFLNEGQGCRFESTIEDCHLARLRPGEIWTLKAKIDVPIEFYQESQLTEHPVLKDLISQINGVLRTYSSYPAAQHILSARLEYQHSLLPAPQTICLETHCTVSRTTTVPFQGSGIHHQDPRLVSYELDDEDLSISLGSASESS